IDGGDYDIFWIWHEGPTIKGGSERFKQYFSVRKNKRTSGRITVSDHFAEWEKAGMKCFNLTEVALNAEGYQSSGRANVTKNVITVGGTPEPTEPPTEAPTDSNGYYFYDTFEDGMGNWAERGEDKVAATSAEKYKGSKSAAVTDLSDYWNGIGRSLSPSVFKPGSSYSFSAMAMQNTTSSEHFKLSLEYTDASGEQNWDTVAEADGSKGEWVQLANTSYTIPTGASGMTLYVETDDTTTPFFVDEMVGGVKGATYEGYVTPTQDKTDPQEPTQPITEAPGNTLYGDVNNDKQVNILDVITLNRNLMTGEQLTEQGKKNADVDRNGVVNETDSLNILKFLVELIDKLPIGEAPQPTEAPTQAPTQAPTDPPSQHKSLKEFTEECQAKMADHEPDSARMQQAGVTYGTVKSGTYFSTTCNREKPYNILLPAGYDESKTYPVLYCMHGYYENQDRMIIYGNDTNMQTKEIIGNAIAAGEAKDMIVVFPYIYSSATQKDCSGMDAANNAAYDNFINDLTKDLMPHIEKTYPVKTGKDNTAITGFSMGGRESLAIGMTLSEKFGYIGAICPAPGVDDAYKGGWKFESGKEPYLIMITAGGNDTVVYDTPKPYHENLEKNGVPHIWHYYQNGYHGNNSIYAHIYNFCRFVFQN
ncbi:MAG: carbohydrate binding domain-containing protein, partial [Oscillospiraceae bacterium]|nr:carbohydrate binding domain-containing protein [Oscillospiraceae bacterium]